MAQHFMGGVNATGKSAIAREVGRVRPEFSIIHTGSTIMDRFGIAPGDKAALRAIPAEVKYHENGAMLTELAEKFGNKPVMYDSHYLNMIEGTVTPLLQSGWLAGFHSLVLVEVPPEVLYERIDRDAPIKDRKLFPVDATPGQAIDILRNYCQQTRDEHRRLASMTGLPSLVLHNDSGQLHGIVQEFLDFDEHISPIRGSANG